MPEGATVFLIWSIEHDAWWGPARRGYTRDIRAAGRYAVDEVTEIVADANIAGFNECAVPLACVEPQRQHEWEFYMNGSFCKRCGVAIGSGQPCR